MVKLNLVTDRAAKEKYYDVTIIIDKDSNALLIDNSDIDYKDFVDCNTLKIETLKIII